MRRIAFPIAYYTGRHVLGLICSNPYHRLASLDDVLLLWPKNAPWALFFFLAKPPEVGDGVELRNAVQ